MKASLRFALSLVAVAAIASISVAAQKVTGSWKGHIKFDASKMKAGGPAGPGGPGGPGGKGGPGGGRGGDPAKMAERMAKMSITLTLNADKTFTRVMKGGPRGDMTQKGTWSQAGNEITLVTAKPEGGKMRGGEPSRPPKPTILTVSKGGKSLVGTMMRGAGTITFTR